MTDEEQKRKLRNLKNVLTRRTRYIPVPHAYQCEGGPFHARTLFLQTPSTCHLVIGEWRGRYNQVNDGGHHYHISNDDATVTWESSNATH